MKKSSTAAKYKALGGASEKRRIYTILTAWPQTQNHLDVLMLYSLSVSPGTKEPAIELIPPHLCHMSAGSQGIWVCFHSGVVRLQNSSSSDQTYTCYIRPIDISVRVLLTYIFVSHSILFILILINFPCFHCDLQLLMSGRGQ